MSDFTSKLIFVLIGAGLTELIHFLRDFRGSKDLRNALYKELAHNYKALRIAEDHSREDRDWIRRNLPHDLLFNAYKKAAENPGRFARMREHDWLQGSFVALEKCKTLPTDDQVLMRPITNAAVTIERISPNADEKLFKSNLPNEYMNPPFRFA